LNQPSGFGRTHPKPLQLLLKISECHENTLKTKLQITRSNVLRFVESLLALTYGDKISIPEDKLENKFKIEWTGKDPNQLFISGDNSIVTSKRTVRKEKRELGTTKKDLWILIKAYCQDDQALRLPKNINNTPANYQKLAAE